MSNIVSDGGGSGKSKAPLLLAGAAVVAIAVAGAYFGSPYLAVSSLAQAARAGDTDKLTQLVDFAQVREGLKVEFTAALTQRFRNDPDMANNPFGGLASVLAPAIVGKLVDAVVTPAGVAAMVETGRADPSPPEGVAAAAPAEPKAKVSAPLSFVSMNQVRVATKVDGKPGAVLTLDRQGLFSWKLTRIGLPPSALAELNGSAPPPAPSQIEPALPVAGEPLPPPEATPVAEAIPEPSPLAGTPAAPPLAAPGAPPPLQVAAARPAPRPAQPVPQSPREWLAADPALRAREQKVRDMLVNARDRDVSGQVMDEELDAREAWSRCRTRACLQAWYSARERALGVWEGN